MRTNNKITIKGYEKYKLLFQTINTSTKEFIRVSEQESRFAFVETLIKGPYFYSPESPTKKNYQFSGKKPISAQSDLTVYSDDLSRLFNIEFKSRQFSQNKKDNSSISKDIQKLLREDTHGLWHHLLISVNNKTIPNLINVISEQINEVINCHSIDIGSPGISIHICVLKHHFSIHQYFPVDKTSLPKQFITILPPELSVTRDKLNNKGKLNGWSLLPAGNQDQSKPELEK